MASTKKLLTAKMIGSLVLAAFAAVSLSGCGGGGGSGNSNPAPNLQDSGVPSASSPNGAAVSDAGLPLVQLYAGTQRISAEVADTEEQRELGLMFRTRLPVNDGMLFIFSEPTTVCMWMQDTLIPLSVAFIDENGVIVNIEDMEPQTTEQHCSSREVARALEMNQGWFSQNNIQPGSAITGLP